MDRQMPPNVSFLSGRDTAPAYWMYNILWVPLIEGHQTGGSFSVIEQWMRKDAGALVPHVHNFCDEWFYMIDGTIEFTVSGEKLPAKAGAGWEQTNDDPQRLMFSNPPAVPGRNP